MHCLLRVFSIPHFRSSLTFDKDLSMLILSIYVNIMLVCSYLYNLYSLFYKKWDFVAASERDEILSNTINWYLIFSLNMGDLLFSTQNWTKSQFYAPLRQPKVNWKIWALSEFDNILPEHPDSFATRWDKNHIKDSFEYLRTWGIHCKHYFSIKIKKNY